MQSLPVVEVLGADQGAPRTRWCVLGWDKSRTPETLAEISYHLATYRALAPDATTRENGGGLRWKFCYWAHLRFATGVGH